MTSKIQIPNYKIIRELGHGGMAHVYLAFQESFGREVALKVLAPHLTDDPQFSKRFLREAKIVSQLQHPNIVTVYDAGKYEKYHFMSMEYIPGKDVKQLRDSITRVEAIRIVKDVARALEYAGGKGIVHRDIKPENIMIHELDKRVILMDFGIAHGDDVTHGMTQTGKAIGTPHFMSPEQTKGLRVDYRSDIYSLGVVLYQLLAGHLPFDATSAVAVGIKHLTAPIPMLPAGLEIFQPIVNTCLSKKPEHRYQKASDLIAALDKISDEQIKNINTQAVAFRQAGADHDAETQISNTATARTPQSTKKIPNIVFPSGNNKKLEKITDETSNNKNRRNLLILLLLAAIAWAGNEKQKELVQLWGDKIIPKVAKTFPNLLPKYYVDSWADKKTARNKKIVQSSIVAESNNPNITAIETNNTAENISSETQNITIKAVKPVKKTLSRKDKILFLKDNLNKNPENAIELATIYKKMLLSNEHVPVARQGLNKLRKHSVLQILSAIDLKDTPLAHKYIDLIKKYFPKATTKKRFIRLQNKVAHLQRIDDHLFQAEKYFQSGAISKPLGANALNEINKILRFEPGNQRANKFITKIVDSYLEKTTQLQKQGNVHNAILMVEEGIAALNNKHELIQKRKELKNTIKHNKDVVALFKLAKKYQSAGALIEPQAYNAYYVYQKILSKEKNNLQAKAELKSIHQQLAKDILKAIHKGELVFAEKYLEAALHRYGRSSLLANVQLKLNDAFDELAPKIEVLKLSRIALKRLDVPGNTEGLHLNRTLYIGFNFINFPTKTTWLEANLFNSSKVKIAQKPVVISSQTGEHFFEINLPVNGFSSGNYKLEIKLSNKTLISKAFSVQTNDKK